MLTTLSRLAPPQTFVVGLPAERGWPSTPCAEPEERQTVVVEVRAKRLEVSLPGGLALGGSGGDCATSRKKARS
jgi:acetyl-CoA/propionyl-CoA carboxylase biotin carboxyl carrier protein